MTLSRLCVGFPFKLLEFSVTEVVCNQDFFFSNYYPLQPVWCLGALKGLDHVEVVKIFFFFFFFFFCVPQLWGSPLLGEIFAYVTVF